MQLRVKTFESAPARLIVAEGDTFEDEIASMLAVTRELHLESPDVVIETCMGYMARCTEMKVICLRNEGRDRRLKVFRTQMLQPTMELLEFMFKGSSRLVEVARIESELSR